MVVAVDTTVIVFNWLCMEGLGFKILRHLQASQENICSRNFGTHEREVYMWESSAH